MLLDNSKWHYDDVLSCDADFQAAYPHYRYIWTPIAGSTLEHDWVVEYLTGGIFIVDASGPCGLEAKVAGPYTTVDEAKLAAIMLHVMGV